MNDLALILWASIALQGLTVVLALRLIPLTGRALAWVLLSLGFLLMMARRAISLLREEGYVESDWLHNFSAESVALLISVTMLLGVVRIRGIFTDWRRADRELRKLSSAVEHSPSSTIITDPSGCIEYVNPKFTQVTGYSADEVVGKNPRLLKSGETPEGVYEELWRSITAGDTWSGEFRNRRKDGSLYWERASISPVLGKDGAITHFVAIQEDVTERKRHAAALEYQALHDALTDLPNRTLFFDRLQQVIRAAHRSGDVLSVLVMDLDGFKEINDTLGHFHGDIVLKQVGTRLTAAVREADTVARLGGDEFALLLPGASTGQALDVVTKLGRALKPSFDIDGRAVDLGASIGVVTYPEHGEDASTLVQRADVAMYMAKRACSGAEVYDPEQDPHSLARMTLLTDLRQALEGGGLSLCYQPKVDLAGGAVTGVEALLRWQHPRHGLMGPDAFIPFAEQTALIKALTQWVLNEALAQLSRWRERGWSLTASVNLSARDLEVTELPELVGRLLARYAVPPRQLILELTENAIMTDPARALEITARLAAMGVRLSIDDFGTGYSSLASLKQLPVAELKIDKGFVMDMHNDENAAIIVRSTIDLGHNLGLTVVAEGVEDQENLQLLTILGCDTVQGFYLSRPLSADALADWLAAGGAAAVPGVASASGIQKP